jgi:EmrB/QacA subfamily drug resistance transporter
MFGRLEYKWLVAICFTTGLFMDLLDMTIVNVALPSIAQDLNVDPQSGASQIQWVVSGYLLSLAVFIPVSGWLGDRFGTKRIFMIALFLFTAASFLCGMAQTIEQLIFFRLLQGVGGGMLTPVGTAMLFRAFPPHERAKGAAVMMIPLVVAPASGPVIGGFLVEYYDWRWIFFINIPVGIFGLVFAWHYIKEEVQAAPGRFDIPGFILASGGLAALIYALAEAGTKGFDDPEVIVFGTAGLISLTVFCLVEFRTAEPMIDVRLFQNRLFAGANITNMIAFAGLTGGLFLLPLMLQAEMGLTALESGLTTFPQAIGVVVMSQVASRVYPIVGPRRLLMLGLGGVTLTTVPFMFMGLDTDLWIIRGLMLFRGMSFAYIIVSLQTASFATISLPMMGRASAAFNSLRQVGSSFGVALLATVLSTALANRDTSLGPLGDPELAMEAFNIAFGVAAGLTFAGMVAAGLLIRDKDAAPTMRQVPVSGQDEEGAATAAAVH